MERTYPSTLADVWELWTTVAGLESWWGPEGFRVEVRSLDLRPGGLLRYAMIAEAPEMVAFSKEHGMPVVTEATITFVAVDAPTRLAYRHRVDFAPGVAPYDVDTEVELSEVPDGVRMVLQFDAMHDETWTGRAVAGWESELGRLERRIAGRAR